MCPLHWSRCNEGGWLCSSCMNCLQGRTHLESRMGPEGIVLPATSQGLSLSDYGDRSDVNQFDAPLNQIVVG